MKSVKKKLLEDLGQTRKRNALYLMIAVCVFAVIAECILRIRQPLITRADHPMHFAYLGIRMFYLLFFLVCAFAAVFEKNVRKIFHPVNEAVKEFDPETADYRECALLLAHVRGLECGMEEMKRKCKVSLFFSRFFLILLYLFALIFFSMLTSVYLSGVNGSVAGLAVYVGVVLIYVFYMAWLIYFLKAKYPVVPHMGDILFLLLLCMYIAMEYIQRYMPVTTYMDTYGSIFWSSYVHMGLQLTGSGVLCSMIFYIYAAACLFRGKTDGVQEKITGYDGLVSGYCSMAEIIWEVEEDEELLKYIIERRYMEPEHADDERNMQQTLEVRENLLNAADYFTDDILEEFAPLFELIPDWAIELTEA